MSPRTGLERTGAQLFQQRQFPTLHWRIPLDACTTFGGLRLKPWLSYLHLLQLEGKHVPVSGSDLAVSRPKT